MKRMRALAGAVAVLLPISAVAITTSPAEAGSLKRHGLEMYKLEQFVALDGEYPGSALTTTIRCNPGAVAVDGSWVVDDYEAPNADEGVAGDERSVKVLASYGGANAADGYRDWTFSLENVGTGRAQLKLFVSCLELATGNQHGHSHQLKFDERETVPGLSAVTAGGTVRATTAPCDDGQILTAPGFAFTSDGGGLSRSMPFGLTNWEWRFDTAGTATFYVRCLSLRTTKNEGHVHSLDLDWSPSATLGTPIALGQSDREIRTVDATKRDFATMGAFTIASPAKVTYLGSGQRGRERDFTFWNTEHGQQVSLGVLSLGRRTSQQLKPLSGE